MSVTAVDLVDRSSSIGSGGKQYTRVYRVTTTDKVADSEAVVLVASGVPERYSTHPEDDQMMVISKSAKPDQGSNLHWLVTCEYGPTGVGVSPGSNKPWELPAKVSYFTEYEKIAGKSAYQGADVQGAPTQPIINSAGDPFAEPAELDNPRLGIRIVKNVVDDDFSPSLLSTLINTVNIKYHLIAGIPVAIKSGKLRDIRPEPMYTEDNDLYWQITYEIVIDPMLWRYRPLDQGFNQKDPGTQVRTKIKASGQDVTVPVLLDGAGQPKAEAAAAVYLDFDVLFAADWTSLNLPTKQTGED